MKIPKEWTFKNEDVANHFDSHVREQLPWYDVVTEMTKHIIRGYLPQNGVLIDLGCSTGNVTSRLRDVIESRKCKVLSVDNSLEMEKLFNGVGEFVLSDITDFNLPYFDVAVCFLSLMFIDVSKRKKFITKLTKKCRAGGAVIIVDKLHQSGGYIGTVISRMTMSNKLNSGCSASDILDKELSISGIQRPISHDEIIGFRKWLLLGDFAGFIYEKR